MYDEIEICPLNVYHVHLMKTENISDYGKLSGILLLYSSHCLLSLFGAFLFLRVDRAILDSSKCESEKNSMHNNKDPN